MSENKYKRMNREGYPLHGYTINGEFQKNLSIQIFFIKLMTLKIFHNIFSRVGALKKNKRKNITVKG